MGAPKSIVDKMSAKSCRIYDYILGYFHGFSNYGFMASEHRDHIDNDDMHND